MLKYVLILISIPTWLLGQEAATILVEPIRGKVNTSFQEFGPSLSPDAKTLYFYSKRTAKGYTEIFKSKLEADGEWSFPEEVTEVNSDFDDQSPFLTRDGKTMYLSSNRDGSVEVELENGKIGISRDLFVSNLQAGKWSAPVPLSRNINTEEIEENPHSLGDILLFTRYPFGKPELAKIFITKKSGDVWSDPKPLPAPINDEHATIAAAFNDEGTILFFSSNRPGGYGGFDLYMMKIENGKYNNLENLGNDINSDSDEGYIIYQQVKKTFLFCRRVANRSFDIFSASIPKKPNLIEEALKENQKVSIDTIYFERASSKLKNESTASLDNIVDYLHENPKTKMRIIGHTDLIGNFEDNMSLSKERATSVKEYLIRKGVDERRLETTGKGPSEPLIAKTDEESSKKNRRTEFVLLEK
ncbi:OmpA family protein [Leptospira ognonensis]|uniref:OmpA family protein n=1 Tax=Leptospira ognonensis TaxID=2484945 RepID=A0A4R9K933_9LEPT|nr:OmpA family protein [Leptospira ognonensis]TGL63147.1 OmpA family protein [Leptospira ognonensis]